MVQFGNRDRNIGETAQREPHPSVDGCFCLWRREVAASLLWGRQGYTVLSSEDESQFLGCNWWRWQHKCQGWKLSLSCSLCHIDQCRLIWRQWRSSFSAWLPWHLFLPRNYAAVKWWQGKINAPLCVFTELMNPGIHLSPEVSQSQFSY